MAVTMSPIDPLDESPPRQAPCIADGSGAGANSIPVVAAIDATAPAGLFRSTDLAPSMGSYLTANVAIRIINFARILILTWIMTQPQFGLLFNILIVANVLIPLCSLGLNEAITRYVPQYEAAGSLAGFARRSLTMLLIVTALAVALLIALSPALGEFFYASILDDAATRAAFAAEAPALARVTGLIVALSAVYFYLMAVLKGLRMFAALSWMELTHSVLFLAACVAMMFTGQLSAFTIASLYAASLAIPCVAFGLRLMPILLRWESQLGQAKLEGLERKLIQFSIWTTLAGVTWQALLYYPAWHLNKIHGKEAMAVFGAARQLGNIVFIGAVAISTVVMATITRTWEASGRVEAERQLSLAFRAVGLSLLFVCVGLSMARDWIIRLLSPAYAEGAEVLPLHLLFFLLGAYLAFLPAHFHLRERTRQMLWPWVAGVAVNVLLAIHIVGPRTGAVVGTAVHSAVDRVMSLVFVAGLIDARGLAPAAWCGVAAMVASVAVCVLLVTREKFRLDRGSILVLFAALIVPTQWWLLLPAATALLLAAVCSNVILTRAERRKIFRYIAEMPSHVPALRKLMPGVYRDHG